MHGVDEAAGAAGPERVGEDEWTLRRPPPWRSPLRRGWLRAGASLRPWIAWFGLGRLVSAVLTVVVAVALGWWLLRPAPPPTESRLPYASAPVVASSAPPAASAVSGPAPPATVASAVVVHMAGAVVRPGLVELPPGARVQDGVAAAGGVAADADVAAVNLAAMLVDGQQVYVPRVGETPPLVAAVPGGTTTGAPAGPIDVNRATAAELDGLPGVGPATAAAIVAHRDEHGPFPSIEDLESVRGIGPAKLDALRGLVTT